MSEINISAGRTEEPAFDVAAYKAAVGALVESVTAVSADNLQSSRERQALVFCTGAIAGGVKSTPELPLRVRPRRVSGRAAMRLAGSDNS